MYLLLRTFHSFVALCTLQPLLFPPNIDLTGENSILLLLDADCPVVEQKLLVGRGYNKVGAGFH